jgi:hypothetical protein
MKIAGTDADTWLEFLPVPEISDRSFAVTAATCGYRVANDSVALLEPEAFLADLARFEATRRGEARLEGTYEFELHVSPHQGRGDALVRFRVVDPLPPVGNVFGACRLDGALVLPGEAVGAFVERLRQLLGC